jgi:hypothetical protein
MAERVQTMTSLKRRYPKEWLLLTHVTADELTRPIRGKLVAHSKNRDDIYDRLSHLRAKSTCITYTGPIPKDLAVVFRFSGPVS